jgi:hypothetical protein
MGKSDGELIIFFASVILLCGYLAYLLIKAAIWLITTLYNVYTTPRQEKWEIPTPDDEFWKRYHQYQKKTTHRKKPSGKYTYNAQSRRGKSGKQERKKSGHTKKKQSKHEKKIAEALRLLNLTKNASRKEIKHAYRVAVKQWHPDRNGKWEAEKKVMEITNAYTLLLTTMGDR